MWVELWVIAKTAGHILAELWWFIPLAVIIVSVMSALRLDRWVVQFLHQAGLWAIMGALVIGYTYNLF